jgi:molecular chaperone GrpE
MTNDWTTPADEPTGAEEVELPPGLEPDERAAVTFIMPAPAYEAVVTGLVEEEPIVASTDLVMPEVSAESAPTAEAVRTLGDRVEQGFDELKALFQREIRAETTREKVVDRLHAELQEYKQDLLLGTLRPVFIDLIQLHDDIGKVAVTPAGGDGEGFAEAQRLVGLMAGFQQGIEDILYRQGVEPFHVEGDLFDPRRQRAVATVANDDPALSKTVAARLRKGFRSGERVIRPEIVSVYASRK